MSNTHKTISSTKYVIMRSYKPDEVNTHAETLKNKSLLSSNKL